MRVISGIYKRRRFDVPRTFKARPTTDFAKENLFNVLSNYIDFEEGVTALDLFAGTGSISIELSIPWMRPGDQYRKGPGSSCLYLQNNARSTDR